MFNGLKIVTRLSIHMLQRITTLNRSLMQGSQDAETMLSPVRRRETFATSTNEPNF